MTLSTAYFALLLVGLGLTLNQLLVKQKRLEHLFFAMFCGSMAMVAAQQLSAETLGPYRYVLAIGSCMTCNALWLTAKAMFSGEDAVEKKHIVVALVIAVLVVINSSVQMGYELSALTHSAYTLLNNVTGQVANLLSSTVLVLTCWEALNGISKQNKQALRQRIMFVASFCIGLVLCTVVSKAIVSPDMQPIVSPWLMVVSAVQIMLITQVILWQQNKSMKSATESVQQESAIKAPDIDPLVVSGITTMLIEQKGYLAANLKMIDVANALNVSEYKISRAIRYHFAVPNFSSFINSLRIEHAKGLLERTDAQQHTILEIALESGFSSLATFNRVFKAQSGYAPNQHRKNAQLACLTE